MKIIREKKWLVGCFLIVLLITGLATQFQFGEVTLQFHDSYLVMHALYAILYGTVLLYTVINLYRLLDLVTTRYLILALIVALVVPIIILFGVLMVYTSLQSLQVYTILYPTASQYGHLIPMAGVGLVVFGLIWVEIKMIKRLQASLK